MKITFVCTGNICRSPLAEAILRRFAPKVQASSSGTQNYHIGESPDYRVLKVAKANGISMEGITSKQITLKDLEENDYIFAVTRKHKEQILRHFPAEFAHKIHVLLEFTGTPNSWSNDIRDPYYGTEEDFTEVFELLSKCCEDLVKKLNLNS
jgi:protein-tyrosine phosphatase